MHLASWRLFRHWSWTLTEMILETTVQDPRLWSRNRMLSDGPKGGYRQKSDERMYKTVYGGVWRRYLWHMWMLSYRGIYANRSCMSMLDWWTSNVLHTEDGRRKSQNLSAILNYRGKCKKLYRFLSNVLWDLMCLRFSFYYSGPVSMHFSKALCLINLISNCVFDYCTLLLWGGALLVFISVKKEPWFWHKYTDVEVADP